MRIFERKLLFWRPSLVGSIFLVSIFIVIGLGTLGWIQNRNTSRKPLTPKSSVFAVQRASPLGKTSLPEYIEVTFNEPVEPHTIHRYFVLTPAIPGEFTAQNPYTIRFTPETPFPRGQHISFLIKSGASSTTGLWLPEDFAGSFDTEIASNDVGFTNNGLFGRVFTFAKSETPATVTLDKGKSVGDVTVNVYKSSQTQFLAFLAYEEISKKSERSDYSWKQKTYINPNIAHTPFQLITKTPKAENGTVIILPKDTGIYYLEATGSDGLSVGASFVLINTTGLIVRQDDQKLAIASVDNQTGTTISDPITITTYSAEKTISQRKEFVLSGGLSTTAYGFDEPIDFVIGKKGEETIFVPVKLPDSQADIRVTADLSREYKIFLITERPIYKPGDTVFYRGIVRNDHDSLYQLPQEGTPIKIWTELATNTTPIAIEQTATTQKGGVFHGFFTIPKDISLPTEWDPTNFLYAKVTSGTSLAFSHGSTYFSVDRYTKPTFTLAATVEKSEYIGQDSILFTIEGKTLTAEPLRNAQVKIEFYSEAFYEVEKKAYNQSFNVTNVGMCGGGIGIGEEYFGSPLPYDKGKTITLNDQGKATVTYTFPKELIEESRKLTLVATRDDEHNNTITSASTALVHSSDQNVFFYPSPSQYSPNDSIIAPFYVETLHGSPVRNTSFTTQLVKIEYGTNTPKETSVYEYTITTDASGKGTIRIPLPPDTPKNSTYQLLLRGKDSENRDVIKRKQLSIINPTNALPYAFASDSQQTYLKIISQSNSYLPGEIITATVNAPKDMDALLTLERGRLYDTKMIRLVQGDNSVNIPVTEIHSPSITMVFSFFRDGNYYSEGIPLNVPTLHKLMSVEVTSDKETYSPGETARLTIKTSNAQHQPVPSTVSVAIVDKAIFALRKNASPPIHSSWYFFRGRTTNASSSRTWVGNYNFGGRGGGGGGGSGLGNTVDTLYWNPLVTTDQNGMAVIDVPLGNTKTTWNALLFASTDLTDVGQIEKELLVK